MNKLFSLVLIVLFLSSCNNDDDTNPNSNLTLNLTGLESLGANYRYEGWIMVNGTPISTGTFSSVTFPQTFSVNSASLAAATAFVLTIEPTVDTDPAPSNTKLMAGNFTNNTAAVSTKNMVGDFSNSTGKFILATPTDGMNNNEESGVWFLDISSGAPAVGLNLPTLPSGWNYEGWVVINGTPISTGTFTSFSAADSNALTSPYKGSLNSGPPFPGEDFVTGSVGSITFPTDLRGKTVVITVEPSPDNSTAPFTLKPLAKVVDTNAAVHNTISMGQGPLTVISGTASR